MDFWDDWRQVWHVHGKPCVPIGVIVFLKTISMLKKEEVSTTKIYEKANRRRLKKVVDSLPNLLLTG